MNVKKIFITGCLIMLIINICVNDLYGQVSEKAGIPNAQTEKKNYVGTSVLSVLSLIPGDNSYYAGIDYGRKLNQKNDLVVGLNIYKYISPMSVPLNDTTSYPGHVVSSGIVFAFQHYMWKNVFIDQLCNPLILVYKNENDNHKTTGFMLLLAARIGLHFNFNAFNVPLYIEAGGEINYWPVNRNVPDNFKQTDNKYNNYVFAPAIQIGIMF